MSAVSPLAAFKVPEIHNEPLKNYAPNSPERAALQAAITQMEQELPFEVPCFIDGKPVRTAIESALAYKSTWEATPWADRAAIFLKAADLISTNKYRPLEGFVFAVSPFNFIAIAGNFPGAPALVGNVVIWKPSPAATYSNCLIHHILPEAGLPPQAIQFVPSPPAETVQDVLALHFTESTFVFKKLWQEIETNIHRYKSFPRIVGETGGKNFHLVHPSANVRNAVLQSVRSAFEYQGQRCSALSRLHLLSEVAKIKVGPQTKWTTFMGPVIGRSEYDRILRYVAKAKEQGGEVLIGGTGDDLKGYFIQPTVILTKDPRSVTMSEEVFGPALTFDKTVELIDGTGQYALTGAIFSTDRHALLNASSRLRHATGNVYYTSALPFGDTRASGTNDKAGSLNIFSRFVSARSIKDTFVHLEDGFEYPSNLA
ncbi:delta-1-pyrroline-5-carboxylate dehydrogenase [Amanita rubescens]|nr:delta-1-pyrroline-5-carboxylate dehydrogenase [Amanita rubescens]